MNTIVKEQRARPLTNAQKQDLVNKCRGTLNWSDWGYWIGSGKAPNCSIKDNISNSLIHTYTFPSDQSANKWNQEWEKVIRYGGHIASTALTAVLAIATGGTAGLSAGIIVGSIAAIAKDELQAKIYYPKLERGWKYQTLVENHFSWSPHPWAQNELVIKSEFRSYDSLGQLVNSKKGTRRYNLSELPDGIGRLIASSPSKNTSSSYA